MNPTTRTVITHHLPAILYAALIISVSSIPRLKAPELGFLATDKLIHAVEYGLFAFLFFRSFSQLGKFRKTRIVGLITFLFLVIFAAGDEYHQRFVRGRSMDGFDFLADVAGGGLVILWMSLRRKRSRLPDAGADSA